MNRRGFLKAILAAAVAPAVVRAESLMRVVSPKLAASFILYGDGIHDDTIAINALLAGKLVMTAAGVIIPQDQRVVRLPAGDYSVSSPLVVSRNDTEIIGSKFTRQDRVEDCFVKVEDGVNRISLIDCHFTGGLRDRH